jgi:Homeobox KN domain
MLPNRKILDTRVFPACQELTRNQSSERQGGTTLPRGADKEAPAISVIQMKYSTNIAAQQFYAPGSSTATPPTARATRNATDAGLAESSRPSQKHQKQQAITSEFLQPTVAGRYLGEKVATGDSMRAFDAHGYGHNNGGVIYENMLGDGNGTSNSQENPWVLPSVISAVEAQSRVQSSPMAQRSPVLSPFLTAAESPMLDWRRHNQPQNCVQDQFCAATLLELLPPPCAPKNRSSVHCNDLTESVATMAAAMYTSPPSKPYQVDYDYRAKYFNSMSVLAVVADALKPRRYGTDDCMMKGSGKNVQGRSAGSPVIPQARESRDGCDEEVVEITEKQQNTNSNPIAVLTRNAKFKGDTRASRLNSSKAHSSQPLAVIIKNKVVYDPKVVARFTLLQTSIRASPFLASMLVDVYKKSFQNEAEHQARNHAGLSNSLLSVLDSFPPADDDVENLLGDAAGIPPAVYTQVKLSLLARLNIVRDVASTCLKENDNLIKLQSEFRPLAPHQVRALGRRIVEKFLDARQKIIGKYKSYLDSLKWLEVSLHSQRSRRLTMIQNSHLRIWLFQNFTWPYPDQPTKLRLCAKLGLTITQVNNWFINARLRYWKPIITMMTGQQMCHGVPVSIPVYSTKARNEKIHDEKHIDGQINMLAGVGVNKDNRLSAFDDGNDAIESTGNGNGAAIGLGDSSGIRNLGQTIKRYEPTSFSLVRHKEEAPSHGVQIGMGRIGKRLAGQPNFVPRHQQMLDGLSQRLSENAAMKGVHKGEGPDLQQSSNYETNNAIQSRFRVLDPRPLRQQQYGYYMHQQQMNSSEYSPGFVRSGPPSMMTAFQNSASRQNHQQPSFRLHENESGLPFDFVHLEASVDDVYQLGLNGSLDTPAQGELAGSSTLRGIENCAVCAANSYGINPSSGSVKNYNVINQQTLDNVSKGKMSLARTSSRKKLHENPKHQDWQSQKKT